LTADLIQDLYLKELRAYKPPPQKASDAEGHVQKFTPPAAPKSPEETNLASEMKEYEEQVVEIEGAAAPGETQSAEEDFFEDIEAIDREDQEGAHH
jgi:F-type H+-transporting ATPase subunit h